MINGRKIPSRDKIIRLALALGLSLDECQTALKFCGRSQLYPRIKRDSIIIHGINRKLSIYEVSDKLLSLGEEDLKITFFKGRGKNGKKMSVLSERNA